MITSTKPQNPSAQVYRARVLIVGEQAVGKSAILECLCSDGTSFLKNYATTPCIHLRQKMFNLPDTNDSVELLFVDSSGVDVYENLIKKIWPQNCLVCFVYDVTRKATFEKLTKWVDMVQPFVQKNMSAVLLAHKTDLASRRIVSESYGRDFAQKNRLTYAETSAKENIGIQDVFASMAQEVYRKTAKR